MRTRRRGDARRRYGTPSQRSHQLSLRRCTCVSHWGAGSSSARADTNRCIADIMSLVHPTSTIVELIPASDRCMLFFTFTAFLLLPKVFATGVTGGTALDTFSHWDILGTPVAFDYRQRPPIFTSKLFCHIPDQPDLAESVAPSHPFHLFLPNAKLVRDDATV